MSIKPNPFAVWPGGVLDVHGRDAQAFLHAQLTSDVKALAPGAWQWSGWLNPKGRVIPLAALQRAEEHRFRLLLPDHPAAQLAEKLQRFVFRSKLALEPRDDLILAGSREPVPQALDFGGRWLGFGSSDYGVDEWAVEDLAQGLPRLPAQAIESHTPQMLGLDFLAAYSVKKGCYPGQEIVARTHFLGQAKRRLRRLAGDTPFMLGEALWHAGQILGEVLCAASCGDRHEAQAVLPIELDAAALQRASGAGDARLLAFLPGLAR
jgi:folate-binding protein YgfZ